MLIIASAAVSVTLAAAAHHSRSGYAAETSEIRGEIVEVFWANPHPRFTLKVAGADGREERWRVEAWGNVMGLERGGATKAHFVLGQSVTVAGGVSRAQAQDFLGMNMLLADGTEVLLRADAEPRWRGPMIGGRDPLDRGEETRRNAARENRGIFRVWNRPLWEPGGGVEVTRFQYSEQALAARARWVEAEDPIARCEQPALPRLMMNPHPFEFIDRGATIEMRGEEFDMVRTIHMSAVDPATQPASRLGVSLGRWEGKTLVVETTRFDYPFLNQGVPMSTAASMVERYTLSDDQSRLDYRFEIANPGYLAEPGVFAGYWLALGRQILLYDCQPG